MIDSDRLDELDCFRMEEDTPDDARISIPWRDLRDLVALIPYAREVLLQRAADELDAERAEMARGVE